MIVKSKLRYWVPNALTATGIAFAAISIQCSVDGDYRMAAWWAMLTVLTDKADGAAARFLHASSSFGAQLDSFADFFSFGVAPATLFYAFFSTTKSAGWTEGMPRQILPFLVLVYVICVAARLARFNVTTSLAGTDRFFFGIPTTYTGGLLVAFFTTILKYGDPAWTAIDPSWDHLYVLGHVRLDSVMPVVPWLLIPGAIGMVSTLRMPKLGRTHRPIVDALQFINLIGGYVAGILHVLPEYLFAGGVSYLVVTIYFHFSSVEARSIKLPPLFSDGDEATGDAIAKPKKISEGAG